MAQLGLALVLALSGHVACADAFALSPRTFAVSPRVAALAMTVQPDGERSTAPPLPLSRRTAAARLLSCGVGAWRLVAAEPAAAAGTSSTAPEELAKLEHDALIQLAPEVQGEQRLAAWRREKEEIKQALAREAAGQKPLPRAVEGEEQTFRPPVVTARSSAEALEIGAHLKAIGAVMVCALARSVCCACICCLRSACACIAAHPL